MRTDLINKATGSGRDYYLLILDDDGHIHFANSHLISNFGLKLEKIPEYSFFDLLDLKHEEQFRNTLHLVHKTNNPASAEVAVVNGSLHWIKWEISPCQDEAGINGKYMCVGYDIVQKEKVKKMKKVAEKNYQSIVEGLNTGIVMQDSNGEVLAANQKAAEIFGISIGNIYEDNTFKNMWQTILIDNVQVSYENCPCIKALRTGIAQSNVAITYKTRAGQLKSLLVNSQPLFDENNPSPVSVVSSFIDISQEKKLEAELLQEKIQHQKNITETIFAVQEKERTRIGHELHDNVNQILGTCKLFMDMIKVQTDEDADLKEKVTGYILTAIEEIRNLSKEMVAPQLKEKGLIASINGLVEDLKATNTMTVLFYHQDDVEMLSGGKKVALFRIVQEQVKNTLKYSKAKNLSITLRRINSDAQLIIEDNGIGFDARQTRRGIGLSNIYERTRFYDGKVDIQTSTGNGCRLVVTIPAFR